MRCREIRVDDFEQVVGLLSEGFGHQGYWAGALQRLADHATPPGLPKYGYVLEQDCRLVGVVLLIFTEVRIKDGCHIRCNVSSWYVQPAYRTYASLLAMRASSASNVTFFNVSLAPHTWKTLEALGFTPFVTGRTVTIPALNRSAANIHVEAVTPGIRPDRDLDQAEIDLLRDHQGYGCLCLICKADGERFPFVFRWQRRRGIVRIAQLVYCRDLENLVRFAGPIGRFLMRHGCLFVTFDSNGPVSHVIGQYSGGRPKYRKGGGPVHPGDVAYSEEVVFQQAEDAGRRVGWFRQPRRGVAQYPAAEAADL